MKAWVMVSDHPYFAVTDENGYFKIDNIPEGTYEVGFWQEKLSNLPKKKYVISSNSSEVVVSKDATTKLDFEFQKPVKKAKK